MTQEYYGSGTQFDRSEMFALGAAAGAVITAAISEYLDRRKPKTPWEKAQARGAEALDALSTSAHVGKKRAQKVVQTVSDGTNSLEKYQEKNS